MTTSQKPFYILTLLYFLQPSKHQGTERCLLHDARDRGGAQQPNVVLVSAAHEPAGGADALPHHRGAGDPGDHPLCPRELELPAWTPDVFTLRLCSIHTASASQNKLKSITHPSLSLTEYMTIFSLGFFFFPLFPRNEMLFLPTFASAALKPQVWSIGLTADGLRLCSALQRW